MTRTNHLLCRWLFGALHLWSHLDQQRGGVKASPQAPLCSHPPARGAAAVQAARHGPAGCEGSEQRAGGIAGCVLLLCWEHRGLCSTVTLGTSPVVFQRRAGHTAGSHVSAPSGTSPAVIRIGLRVLGSELCARSSFRLPAARGGAETGKSSAGSELAEPRAWPTAAPSLALCLVFSCWLLLARCDSPGHAKSAASESFQKIKFVLQEERPSRARERSAINGQHARCLQHHPEWCHPKK